MITISSPAKIHLMGEHAVVYGKPALLSAINLRINLSVWEGKQKGEPKEVTRLRKIIDAVVKKHFNLKKIPEYGLSIDSDIPIGCKLGSSAAISASLIAGLLTFLKIDWDLNKINDLTYQAEKVFHGNPSGGDNSAVVFGGLIWFRKEFEFLKSITPLNITIHSNIKPFFLIDSGKPSESTKEMVEIVLAKRNRNKRQVDQIFNNLEITTKGILKNLIEGEENEFIDNIKTGERNLERLGVVGQKAKDIIRLVEKAGGVGKILGGGGIKTGSGRILGYLPDPSVNLKYLQNMSLQVLPIKLEAKGLTVEST